jgi:hypothetical protein
MSLSLSPARMIELAAAVLILGAGIFFYRRRDSADRQSGQGAVILFVVAVVMGIHALGGLDYHPTQSEADSFNGRGR